MHHLQGTVQRLSIYISEKDQFEGKSLYEVIMEQAKDSNLAGVSVFRGLYSYGRDKKIHSMGILRISEDLPLLIQIIDTKENIQSFIPKLEQFTAEALILQEDVTIVAPKTKS
ncbi:DUF190 domain-containing protein [Halodesulfovibrio marinisediminis]|uniref:Uncharacterized protein n=1 Tax=Halodesulfovibrio marinisediminis DSM 17456 TaxID=1121457 RepID=A0A1N6E454_9BACT|nr:DUF190 domain-containing protein [Halodesulfovibrio marinisediminis]SIN77707.1 hypothetical protein SAMN02745161_0688 [Halodesulfovibrio marinisediminis DSM 17456]